MTPQRPDGPLNLIFDADDTLVGLQRPFSRSRDRLSSRSLVARGIRDNLAIRAAMRRHELRIIKRHGYGRRPYVIALHRVAPSLLRRTIMRVCARRSSASASKLIDRHCELLPGVATTLGELGRRHRLLLFTKGDPGEQLRKLDRSGLRPLFSRIGVPEEKDPGNLPSADRAGRIWTRIAPL